MIRFKAPKAVLMAFITDGILRGKLPWTLVLLGVSIAVVLELCGVPSLPFAVGVYLPLSSSTPIFAGGLVRYVVDRWNARGREQPQGEAESDTSAGVLLATGYIAGGTIAGVVIAFLSFPATEKVMDLMGSWRERLGIPEGNGVALAAFGILALILAMVGAGWLLKAPPTPGLEPEHTGPLEKGPLAKVMKWEFRIHGVKESVYGNALDTRKHGHGAGAIMALALAPLKADEGMWLFNNPPRKLLKEKYDFDPTDDWLEHVQKSSVRFNSGGSGSFVSADGLVMTNHHVGADCLQKLSDKEHNYLQRRLPRQDPGRGDNAASTWS